jgi:hypothetical protein
MIQWGEKEGVQLPLHADLMIQDCVRQDHVQFGNQYVWTVTIRLWRGHAEYYPRLADPQFNCSFDIPANWASAGWTVVASNIVTPIGSDLSINMEQRHKVVDMMNHPGPASAHLIKVAFERGILDSKERLAIDVL